MLLLLLLVPCMHVSGLARELGEVSFNCELWICDMSQDELCTCYVRASMLRAVVSFSLIFFRTV